MLKAPTKLDYLRYSGASINIVVNPLHWRLRPVCKREHTLEWPEGPDERTYVAGWLFLTVRVWIDSGRW